MGLIEKWRMHGRNKETGNEMESRRHNQGADSLMEKRRNKAKD